MLTITKLKGAEYLIRSVADGLEDYFMGAGEAPGVWRGAWAAELSLVGVVEADALRALVNGAHPTAGTDLLAGHRERKVRAIDVTLSPAKSVSLLWTFGTPETSATVSIAVVEATEVALAFLEERAAFARQQQGGVRRRVATGGFAIATFAHRTSRAGDPQLHTHCLIPNVVRRADGAFVAFDANPLHIWAKATGAVFQNHLQRLLTEWLGVAWGPERNGTREMLGFTRDQLRAFSKRTVAIETHLEAEGELALDSKRARMRADDRASVRTRGRKDKNLTPERLRHRWTAEAATVGLRPGIEVDRTVLGRHVEPVRPLTEEEIFAALVDPATGLCATDSRFGEAHVVERVAAISAGQLDLDEITAISQRFVGSGLVVRLAPGADRRRPPEWSTVELRAVEDRLLARLHDLTVRRIDPIRPEVVGAAVSADPNPLGADQADAARVLCGAGPAVRTLVAPAGFGKTTTVRAAAAASSDAGRPVVAVAPTHRATAELRAAGLDVQTIARFRRNLTDIPLPCGATVIVDELSQVGTRDAAAILAAVAATPGAQLWLVGDARQAQSVAAGGLAVEVERLAAEGRIPAAGLTVNRRQVDPAERAALARYRAGDPDASHAIRTRRGWEHEAATPVDTREALAEAAVADADRHGSANIAVLAVSHADCEDLADRIRVIRAARGELRGPALTGPGWRTERVYAGGDRVLVHTNRAAHVGVHNGSTGTIVAVDARGLIVVFDTGTTAILDRELVTGCRVDGTPNLSHAWARTVDGAQAGTWDRVHLLGTPTLDRFTCYVGQSRGRQPTHTWNTRPEAHHPAYLLADQRTPSEMVADTVEQRAEPKTLAAGDDPWVLDRRLRAERDHHAGIVATRPPDRRPELDDARQRLRLADEECGQAAEGVEQYQRERHRLGLLTRLRSGGRAEVTRAEQAFAGAHRRRDRANQARNAAIGEVARIERAIADRAGWDRRHGWRLDRIAQIDDTLDHHWAEVLLRAVRADDPLAFGIDRLRRARDVFRADLQRMLRDRAPDHRQERNRDAEAHEGALRPVDVEGRAIDRRRAEPTIDNGSYEGDSVRPPLGGTRPPMRDRFTTNHGSSQKRRRLRRAIADLDLTLQVDDAQRAQAAQWDAVIDRALVAVTRRSRSVERSNAGLGLEL